MMSDSIPDSQNPETAGEETGGWAEVPASWIRACVLDDLVHAGPGGHEQITAALPLDDGLFALFISPLTDEKQSIRTPEEDLLIFNPFMALNWTA